MLDGSIRTGAVNAHADRAAYLVRAHVVGRGPRVADDGPLLSVEVGGGAAEAAIYDRAGGLQVVVGGRGDKERVGIHVANAGVAALDVGVSDVFIGIVDTGGVSPDDGATEVEAGTGQIDRPSGSAAAGVVVGPGVAGAAHAGRAEEPHPVARPAGRVVVGKEGTVDRYTAGVSVQPAAEYAAVRLDDGIVQVDGTIVDVDAAAVRGSGVAVEPAAPRAQAGVTTQVHIHDGVVDGVHPTAVPAGRVVLDVSHIAVQVTIVQVGPAAVPRTSGAGVIVIQFHLVTQIDGTRLSIYTSAVLAGGVVLDLRAASFGGQGGGDDVGPAALDRVVAVDVGAVGQRGGAFAQVEAAAEAVAGQGLIVVYVGGGGEVELGGVTFLFRGVDAAAQRPAVVVDVAVGERGAAAVEPHAAAFGAGGVVVNLDVVSRHLGVGADPQAAAPRRLVAVDLHIVQDQGASNGREASGKSDAAALGSGAAVGDVQIAQGDADAFGDDDNGIAPAAVNCRPVGGAAGAAVVAALQGHADVDGEVLGECLAAGDEDTVA